MSARGFIGGGDLYIARIVGGVQGPFVGPFEATKFEIKPNVELKEQVSKSRDGYGQVIETVALAKPSDFTVELPEVNKDSLAIALLGTTIVLSQSSGTVTDEVIVGKHDAWVMTAKKRLSSVVLTNSGASTTYVLGTDYVVNARLGMVKVLSTGAITDAQSLKIDYAHAAITGSKITGATNTEIRAAFMLDGKNFADQSDCLVNAWEGVIASSAAFDFLSSDFAKVTMPGRLKTPTGKTNPFEVDLPTS